ncbi:alternative ribosome rescue aminoacyl-tRNA hydrolase ArfB [Algimonas porphyrae]|uniref:Aminoacyl-tRNA hydrolase n=1 Tax=Algimonas porphyrae TaxID=1128113 RepID=A0ABQ5UW54_9PROT|nr:alternative ribosome rescue aminoacyl-tRNA hydrolase ArfB [Algimonas porphyrae]GLQ19396.1 aminoacyl-tRNA hydrolase [Algimonas porphyrae]
MDDLHIRNGLMVPASAISVDAVKGTGPGGQSVNKTNSAAQLRAYVDAFGWPDGLRDRVLKHADSRISESQRAVIIHVSTHRSFHRNQDEAMDRLARLLQKALHRDKPRRKTRPSRSAVRRAVKARKHRAEIKSLRGPVRDWQ